MCPLFKLKRDEKFQNQMWAFEFIEVLDVGEQIGLRLCSDLIGFARCSFCFEQRDEALPYLEVRDCKMHTFDIVARI